MRAFKLLKGQYTMSNIWYKPRATMLASEFEAREHDPLRLAAAGRVPRKIGKKRLYSFMSSCALPYYDSTANKVDRGVSCTGCQVSFEDMKASGRLDKAVADVRDLVYAEDEFMEHFQWCENAQVVWTKKGVLPESVHDMRQGEEEMENQYEYLLLN